MSVKKKKTYRNAKYIHHKYTFIVWAFISGLVYKYFMHFCLSFYSRKSGIVTTFLHILSLAPQILCPVSSILSTVLCHVNFTLCSAVQTGEVSSVLYIVVWYSAVQW